MEKLQRPDPSRTRLPAHYHDCEGQSPLSRSQRLTIKAQHPGPVTPIGLGGRGLDCGSLFHVDFLTCFLFAHLQGDEVAELYEDLL